MAFDTERKKFSKEHLWYVEIEVDGVTNRFCENRAPRPIGLDAIPSLKAVSVSPAEISLDGGIGVRAKCNLTLEESMDYQIWGTLTAPVRFWSRWRAENPYYLGQRLSVFSGYIVNNRFDSSNFIRRDYILESFANSASGVRITGKDPLKLASNDRAKAPRESNGLLIADITDTDTTISLAPSGIGSEYPTSGTVRIGDEVITYTGKTGDDLTGAVRGEFNTIASSHNIDDVVQLCLEYASQRVDDIGYDLLTTYANVDPTYISQTEWAAEVDGAFANTYSVLITEPTGVQDLLKEFAQSAPHYYYWDERVNRIRLKALTAPPVDAFRLNYEDNLIADSTSVQDRQDMRISTVIFNYGIIDPTKDLDETSNYRASYVREDSNSVSNYGGQRAYKTINSRWVSSDNKTAAVLAAARMGRRFAEAPRMISFQVDPKDADVWTGDNISCQTDLIEQAGGGFPFLDYQIISAKEQQNYAYKALENTYGPSVPGDEDVEDPNVRLVYISGEQQRLSDPDTGAPRDLRDLYESVYGTDPLDAGLDVKFIFESNCVAGSDDVTQYAVKTGSWPELTTPPLIINFGLIVGKQGQGASVGGTPGDGGPAIQLENDIRLENVNTIAGAGAGGSQFSNNNAVAAGGSGAGFGFSNPGSGTTYNPFQDSIEVEQAEQGTFTTGGAGGISRGFTGELYVAIGEDGGDLGQSTSGADAGKAIDLNGFTITYIETGTILGNVS